MVSTLFQALPTLNLTVQVRDAKGRLVRSQPPKPMPWHPSFRFFRLSQTTTDLFDAYRNAYLALESLLAARTPQLRKGAGQKGEQEGEWFRRALIATGVDLAKFVSGSRGREADAIYGQLYRDARIRVFHSKPSQDPLLPRDRRTVLVLSRALDLTTGLYLAIAEAHLGVVRLREGFSTYAARTMAEAVLEPLTFIATPDESPFDPAATEVSPSGEPLASIPNVMPASYAGFSARRLAWAEAADLASVPYVRRVVGVTAAGQPLIQSRLEARLAHHGIDRLEVEFRIVMRNGRDLASGLV